MNGAKAKHHFKTTVFSTDGEEIRPEKKETLPQREMQDLRDLNHLFLSSTEKQTKAKNGTN